MDKQAKREVEVRGATVDAAVADALRKLSLGRDDVEIEVIDEGSRGLLGIGSREAVVRVRPISVQIESTSASVEEEEEDEADVEWAPEPETIEPAPVVVQERPKSSSPPQPARAEKSTSDTEGSSAEELAAEQEAAVSVLSELLDLMHVEANVVGELSEADDLTGQQINIIEITGDDLGILIGPRGETLESLQFISRLMVAHRLQRRAHFVVDVEGYRERRQQALMRLAERMADKAVERGQPVSLEPMSSYERRVIHMALRDSPDVYTESSGEGKYRKVRIFPKKS